MKLPWAKRQEAMTEWKYVDSTGMEVPVRSMSDEHLTAAMTKLLKLAGEVLDEEGVERNPKIMDLMVGSICPCWGAMKKEARKRIDERAKKSCQTA